MALLNALDPGGPPTVVKTTDSLALLNVRTLQRGVQAGTTGQSQCRYALESGYLILLPLSSDFLQTQQALNMMREQDGG